MSNDLVTGPVKDTDLPKPKYVMPKRKPELYAGEPPQSNEGKIPQNFTIQQKCLIEDFDVRTGKKGKCQMKLTVARVKNQIYVTDESGYGGQLMYDENDIRQYIQCPKHGSLPSNYQKWTPGSRTLEE